LTKLVAVIRARVDSARSSSRCCQVVLNHCVKGRDLFLAVVTVDHGLPDQRVELSLAQLAQVMRLVVHAAGGAPFRSLPFD